MHQDKHQTYPGIPFKIPFKTMETSRFQQGRKKKLAKTRTVSEICSKNDLFIKILQICKLLARMV